MASMRSLTNLPTPFAKKYGVDPQLSPLKKSGFTPTLPPSIIPKNAGLFLDPRTERYQRKILKGFTARELDDLGAYPDPNAKESTLNNLIDGILKVENWQSPTPTAPGFPIVASGEAYLVGPNPGTWHAENPVVWQILEPVLKLTSRFLSNINTNILIDAFLFGRFRELPPNKWVRDFPGAPDCYSFHTRKPEDRNPDAAKTALQVAFPKLLVQQKIQLTLEFLHPDSKIRPNVEALGSSHAVTWGDKAEFGFGRQYIYIGLNIDKYQPLLRNDLSISEKLAEQYQCSVTLLHEILHAINFAFSFSYLREHDHYTDYEPFFEEHIFSELGFALETSIFDGIIFPFVEMGRFEKTEDKRDNYPHLGFWLLSYPLSTSFEVSQNQRLLVGARRPRFDSFSPIPSIYFENIQQEGFWDVVVRKFGVSVAKPRCSVHTTGTRGSFTPIKPSPMLAQWKMYSDQYLKGSTDNATSEVIEVALSKLPAEKRAEQLQLKRAMDNRRLQERVDFRSGRSDFATRVREAWDFVNASWNIDKLEISIEKLNIVAELIQEEADQQATQISMFVIRKDKDADHRAHLVELNYYMRKMARAFESDVTQKTKDGTLEKIAKDIIVKLETCLVMLHDKNPEPGLSSKEFYDSTEKKKSAAVVSLLTVLQQFPAPMDKIELDLMLLEAQKAITEPKGIRWGTLGKSILGGTPLFGIPFLSAISKLLLSHDGTLEHKDLYWYLESNERASLEEPNNVCSEPTRLSWLAFWNAKKVAVSTLAVGPAPEISVKSSKRSLTRVDDPSSMTVVASCTRREDDDGVVEAILNQIFWNRFRH
ncbi:uncharacterized protein LY89DRAFT_306821 [Mollisia scopiformis]|uniref:Uncharacterized protein n=1 Tax=Mollisia scopiformis TaxID=149040 RepID=A0A194XRH1_MOLSC|nr:uncharacterized protein LY89DRAFT_306821 [Mollisia scopiformis]KUJ22649.1 hypothetical protein LY89DRAFT_306821 [Mollisia scopiformis]